MERAVTPTDPLEGVVGELHAGGDRELKTPEVAEPDTFESVEMSKVKEKVVQDTVSDAVSRKEERKTDVSMPSLGEYQSGKVEGGEKDGKDDKSKADLVPSSIIVKSVAVRREDRPELSNLVEPDGSYIPSNLKRGRFLYVSNLDISEEELRELLRDSAKGLEKVDIYKEFKFAILHFAQIGAAADAQKILWGHIQPSGQRIRCFFGKKTQPSRHIFVGNVADAVTQDVLRDTFDKFGRIETIRMISREWYSFIDYEKIDSAIAAIAHVNGRFVGGKNLIVDFGRSDQDFNNRPAPSASAPLYKLNPPPPPMHPSAPARETEYFLTPGERTRHIMIARVATSISYLDMKKVLEKHGEIDDLIVFPRLFYMFASFTATEDAANAVAALDGRRFDGMRLELERLPARPSPLLFIAESPNVSGAEITDFCIRIGELEFSRGRRGGLLVAFTNVDSSVRAFIKFRDEWINHSKLRATFVKDLPEERRMRQHVSPHSAPPSRPPARPSNPPPQDGESRHLWIGRLFSEATDDSIGREFSKYGKVESVKVFRDKSFGFVDFEVVKDAVRARNELNGQLVCGSRIVVNFKREDFKRQDRPNEFRRPERPPMPVPEYERNKGRDREEDRNRNMKRARDWKPEQQYDKPREYSPEDRPWKTNIRSQQDGYSNSNRAHGDRPNDWNPAPRDQHGRQDSWQNDRPYREERRDWTPQSGGASQQSYSGYMNGDSQIHAAVTQTAPPVQSSHVVPAPTIVQPKPVASGPAIVMTLCKGAAPVCSVISRLIAGPALDLSMMPEQLNVQWRTELAALAQVLTTNRTSLVTLQPLREDDKVPYDKFLEYLQQRNRAGVAKLASASAYILPPGPTSEGILGVNARPGELVAAFVPQE